MSTDTNRLQLTGGQKQRAARERLYKWLLFGCAGVSVVVTVTIVDQPNCGGVDLDANSTTVSQGPTATPTATPMETATPTETATATPTPTDASDPSDGGAARFEVMIDEVRVSEQEGSLEVDATVENTGDAAETQTVALSMDGEELGSRELTLGNGESESVTFSSEAPADGGERDLRVASEGDSDQSSVQLQDDDSGTRFLPENSGAFFLLLLLLLALLVAYYYVRSRRYQSDRVPVDEGEWRFTVARGRRPPAGRRRRANGPVPGRRRHPPGGRRQ